MQVQQRKLRNAFSCNLIKSVKLDIKASSWIKSNEAKSWPEVLTSQPECVSQFHLNFGNQILEQLAPSSFSCPGQIWICSILGQDGSGLGRHQDLELHHIIC